MTSKEEAIKAVRTLIEYWGDDPDREGLKDTPDRVLRAAKEWSAGYATDIDSILATRFDDVEGYDEMIAVRGIEFVSHCEHHMVPFVGKVDIVYLPNGGVLGLSKFGRVVDAFANRLQIQERMTRQIGTALSGAITPRALLARVTASHMCMCHRGVKKSGSTMVTQYLYGEFLHSANQRAEALSLIESAR